MVENEEDWVLCGDFVLSSLGTCCCQGKGSQQNKYDDGLLGAEEDRILIRIHIYSRHCIAMSTSSRCNLDDSDDTSSSLL